MPLPGVGLFGCNNKSEYLITLLNQNGFKIKGLWCDSLNRANEFAKRFKIDFHTDKIDALLLKKEVELILINCQQCYYVSIVTKAFRIGKHVLCDYPNRLSVTDHHKMCEAAAYYPSLISIYHSFPLRFLPQFKLMRNLILEQNYIGDITLINININGRSLIELNNIENLINNQANCKYCKNQIENDKKQQNSVELKNGDNNDKKLEKQFIDPNKVPALNEKLRSIQNKNEQQKSINLNKKIQINNLDNQKYNEVMKEGGLLNYLGPHIIDLLNFLTNLKAKKCNGILRTFNTTLFLNESNLSLIKRITVDDFCTFQMEMYKPISNTNKINKTINIEEKNKAEQQKSTKQSSNQTSLKTNCNNKKIKDLANNNPIAVVTLNDHLEISDKCYEILIGGSSGYLRLKNGNLFGRQYEQNNNGSLNCDKLNEEQEIYLVKNNLNLTNFCILHQDKELKSNMILNNKHIFKPFESGLENLIESMKFVFDAKVNDKTVLNLDNKQESNKVITNGDNKSKDQLKDQIDNVKSKENKISNGHSTVVQINNERNLEMNNSIKVEPLKEKNNLEINSTDTKIKLNNNVENLIINNNVKKQNGHNGLHKSNDNLKDKLIQNGIKKLNGIKSTQNQTTFYINNDTSNCNSLNSDSLNSSSLNSDSLNYSSLNSDLSINNSLNSNTSTELNIKDNDKNINNNLEIIKNDNLTTNNLSKQNNESNKIEIKLTDNDKYRNNRWFKEAINSATSFEDGRYVQAVIQAIRLSSQKCEWIRVQNYVK